MAIFNADPARLHSLDKCSAAPRASPGPLARRTPLAAGMARDRSIIPRRIARGEALVVFLVGLRPALGRIAHRIRPGIDAWTLIDRSFQSRQKDREINKYFGQESPVNTKIDGMKLSVKETNLRKLLYCGQFIVVAERH